MPRSVDQAARDPSAADHSDPATSALPEGFMACEAQIHAFAGFCPAEPPAPGSDPLAGPLAGLTVGVKDIIDVRAMPTRNGSAACRAAAPAPADAAVVAALRKAGARILGKTVTTEFAFTDPTDCRNPHDLQRSPGGSSSGSGAAVAAGLVDLALGTQTAGSLCRPAAYCGVVGFKPSHGALPTTGVTPLAPSFDTVGIIARSVGMAASAFAVMAGAEPAPARSEPRLGAALLPTPNRLDADMQAAFDAAARALAGAGIPVAPVAIRADIAAIVAAHRVVMQAEAVAAHGALLAPDRIALLRPKFRAGLEAGAALAPAEVTRARALLDAARQAFWEDMAGVDLLLTLVVPEGAPLMDGTTGFQDWLTPWTVFGGPLVTLPWGCDRLARPRAVMLAGHPGRDGEVLEMAARLEALGPPRPRPAVSL